MKKALRIVVVVVAVLALLVGGAFVVRTVQKNVARQQIAREQGAPVARLTEFGSTRSLEILPLVENEAAGPYQTEHGVSYLIKTDRTTVLLDVGMNAAKTSPSPLEANMTRLGLTPGDFDTLVISHWHPDHSGGTDWWLKKTFSLGNRQVDLSGKQVYVPTPMTYSGLAPVVATEPVKLADGVALIGTLPFLEVIDLPGVPLRNTEQALAVNVAGKGIVLITGCGHPTLPVLVARAKAVFGQPVVGVIGGLHLAGAPAETVQADIQLLKSLSAQLVGLSPHDSSPVELGAFRQAFPGVYQDVKVGRPIRFGTAS